ncbi:uncharacterized protein LOC121898198 isoform X3 [Thunnus maccoyii]|uniref:uncharacterized protein LOC121898198 isoform X3 n=1 Tax=Thunnus maccoyii TaxID=8240 RepID=UPI001C4BB438|nr:uncharacterized protein LOC121898198 isoform X3 [Thunnus maccoyii]XP_042269041.1 uncharacterized protein LOC121898198 isoform X3 [Thunnus maccoyii]
MIDCQWMKTLDWPINIRLTDSPAGGPNQEEETSSLSSFISSVVTLSSLSSLPSSSSASEVSSELTLEYLERTSKVSDGSEATENQTCAIEVVVGSSRSKRRWRAESNSGDPKTETSKRRSWSPEEVQAVEKTLMAFIGAGTVPGMLDCVACITASPKALKKRSWMAVKYYVKTRITEIQRESARKTN